jgi:hypothetical protein
MSIFLLAACLVTASPHDLLLIEHDIRGLSGSLLIEEVEVLYISTDWFLAQGSGDLSNGSTVSVLESGPIDLSSYRLVHLRTEGDRAAAEAVGEVLFCRGQVALVKPQGEPSFVSYPGVHFVQPLHIYSWSALEPFRLASLSNPAVTEIVATVNEDSLNATIQTLENYQTRLCVMPQYYNACVWMNDRFASYGVSTEIVPFEFTVYGNPYTSYNVVAEKPGLIEPDVAVIICGHLDSITGSNPQETAPGADDNASGSATVLEAARILSQYNFRYSIRFICFGAEELGLIGSEIYAASAAANGDSIIAVINLDMILFAPDSLRKLFVPYNTQSTELATNMDAISAMYVPELDVNIQYSPGTTYSDHASFWQEGFPALLGIEEGVDDNPFYHMNTDLLANYLEYFPFGTECAKAAIATVAVYADPLSEGVGSGEPGTAFGIVCASPVPAASNLTVQLEGLSGSEEIQLILFDITGRQAASISLPAGSGGIAVFDVSTLPVGVYGLSAVSGSMCDAAMVVVAR